MRTRVLASCAALLVGALVAAPGSLLAQDDLTKSLASIEEMLWQGWAEHDVAPFEAHLAANSVQIGEWGMVSGKEAIVEGIGSGDCEVRGYSLSGWKAQKLGDHAAILTYTAEQSGVCSGEKLPQRVYASSVYVREGDQWLSASYQETPAAEE